MGMLTGAASGRILMIDLDFYKAGGDAAKQWWGGVLMTHNNGMTLETWQQRTGGGGIQLFFSYPPGWKFAVNSQDLDQCRHPLPGRLCGAAADHPRLR